MIKGESKIVATFAIYNDSLELEESENKTLTIQNVESFYNYRTVNEDFKLASSVLSNEIDFIELKVKKTGIIPRRVYVEVIPEITPSIQEDFSNLISKKQRILSALIKIRNNTNEDTNNDFYQYFSLPSLVTLQED